MVWTFWRREKLPLGLLPSHYTDYANVAAGSKLEIHVLNNDGKSVGLNKVAVTYTRFLRFWGTTGQTDYRTPA